MSEDGLLRPEGALDDRPQGTLIRSSSFSFQFLWNKDHLSRSHMCTGCELERGEGTREACSLDLTGMSTCDLEETAR